MLGGIKSIFNDKCHCVIDPIMIKIWYAQYENVYNFDVSLSVMGVDPFNDYIMSLITSERWRKYNMLPINLLNKSNLNRANGKYVKITYWLYMCIGYIQLW